jgi:hypothetical protein
MSNKQSLHHTFEQLVDMVGSKDVIGILEKTRTADLDHLLVKAREEIDHLAKEGCPRSQLGAKVGPMLTIQMLAKTIKDKRPLLSSIIESKN